jgi:deoxyribonuclease-4
MQLFTKQPNRWAEPEIDDEKAAAWATARAEHRVRVVVSHDSYLINLASPDPILWEKSYNSFERELGRCSVLGVDLMVTHPGNSMDSEEASGILRNAEGVTRALEAIPNAPTRVLLELTAGSGTSVGGTFEQLAGILDGIPDSLADRVGICFDTCHGYAAGYDLVNEYDAVWASFNDLIGLDRLALFHLNDSKTPFASHRDRHEHIGLGSLGDEPFRRIMTDERFTPVPKVLETPKDDDAVTNDLRNLGRLRAMRSEAGG